jgi:hypothetical protein
MSLEELKTFKLLNIDVLKENLKVLLSINHLLHCHCSRFKSSLNRSIELKDYDLYYASVFSTLSNVLILKRSVLITMFELYEDISKEYVASGKEEFCRKV